MYKVCDNCKKKEVCLFAITLLQFEKDREFRIETAHASWIFEDSYCNDFNPKLTEEELIENA